MDTHHHGAGPDVITFCAITNAKNIDVAKYCLRESNNVMDDAINFYFDQASRWMQQTQGASTISEPHDPDKLLTYWRSPGRWETDGALLPEYAQAMKSMIIKPEIMRDSTMRRALRKLEVTAQKWPPRNMDNAFHKALRQLLRKAWPQHAHHFECRFKNQYVSLFGVAQGCSIGGLWDSCGTLFSLLGWERPYLLRALQLLISIEDSSGLQIIAGLMKRGAEECNARKRAIFYNIVNRIPAQSNHPGQENSLQSILVEYIDSIKEKALQSTFLEPTKMYFHEVQDYTMEGDVDVHGVNGYLVLLASTLGIALNRDPFMREEELKGVVQFTDVNIDHTQGCWSHENLGKTWETIPFCRNGNHQITLRKRNQFYFNGGSAFPVVQIGREAVDPRLPSKARKKLAVYLEQFCSYFSKSFILQRMFTHLTVEQDGEVERKLQIAYDSLRELESQRSGEKLPEDVKFYCWKFSDDLVSCTFNEENALKLFSHIGVCL